MNAWFDFWLYFSWPYTGDFSYFHHGILFKEEKKFSASDVPPVKSEGIYCAF